VSYGDIGGAAINIILVVLGFFIGAAILRGVFAIRKIVDLLGVIAQELRAANAVGDVDTKLKVKGINEQLGEYLNKVGLKEYKVSSKPGEAAKE